MNPGSGNLHVREDLEKGIYLEGISQKTITNTFEAMNILQKGQKYRHVSATNMNEESSRSHSILSLIVESKKTSNGVDSITSSKFHFVDLAGSERQKSTSASGMRLKEAGNINKSLSTLGIVINCLSEGKRCHIPYRDSKLSFLLKDSLGGNSKTCMIANISPAGTSFHETLSTLKFAQRAKMIKNKAKVNQFDTGTTEGLQKEITRLRGELAESKTLIRTLEDGQRTLLKNSPSHLEIANESGEIDSKLLIQQLLETNRNHLEVEVLLRESINVIAETEKHLQQEIERSDSFIGMFDNYCKIHVENDTQVKEVLQLYNDKFQEDGMIPEGLEHQVQSELMPNLLKENEILRKVVSSTPLFSEIVQENFLLKEKLREFEVDDLVDADLNIREKAQQNKLFLMEVKQKMEESTSARYALEKKLEQALYLAELSPQDLDLQRNAVKVKLDLESRVSIYELDKLKLTQKLKNEENKVENLEDRILILEQKNEDFEQDKETLINSYEKRISELKEGFSESTFKSKNTKSKVSLQRDLLSMKDELESYKKKCEEQENQISYMENQYSISLKQKEDLLTFNQDALDQFKEDAEVSKIHSKSSQGKAVALSEEVVILRQERSTLKGKVSDLLKAQKGIQSNLEKTLNEKFMLQNEFDDFKLRSQNQQEYEQSLKDKIFKLETDVKRENMDRRKLEEELDTLQESYSFSLKKLESLQKSKEKDSSSKSKKTGKKSAAQKKGKMSVRRTKVVAIVDDIEGRLETEQSSNLELQKKITELQSEKKESSKANKNLKQTTKKLQERIRQLESELESQKNENREYNEQLNSVESSLQNNKILMMELEKKNSDLIAIQNKKVIDDQNIQQKMIQLQKSIAEQLNDFHSLNKKLQEGKLKNEDLKQQIEDREQQYEGLNDEINILKELNIDYEKQIAGFEQQIDYLQR